MLTQGVFLCVLCLLRYCMVFILFGPPKMQPNERVNCIHLERSRPKSLVDLYTAIKETKP